MTLQAPNITDQLQKYAYIIGYFDGDGSCFTYDIKYGINKTKIYKNFNLSWLGTYNLMYWIQEQLQILCPQVIWNSKPNKHKNIWALSFNKRKAKIIYQSLKNIVEVPRLERKWCYNWEDVLQDSLKDKK